jgi:hypothetical protein
MKWIGDKYIDKGFFTIMKKDFINNMQSFGDHPLMHFTQ